MRVLVCGGRDYRDIERVKNTLTEIHRIKSITCIIEGGARGVDHYAAQWGDEHNLGRLTFFADWQKHGKAAGPIRNQAMLDEGHPVLVIAFPGGRGTADMVTRAEKANIEVLRIR
jgi:hypothetical protein